MWTEAVRTNGRRRFMTCTWAKKQAPRQEQREYYYIPRSCTAISCSGMLSKSVLSSDALKPNWHFRAMFNFETFAYTYIKQCTSRSCTIYAQTIFPFSFVRLARASCVTSETPLIIAKSSSKPEQIYVSNSMMIIIIIFWLVKTRASVWELYT